MLIHATVPSFLSETREGVLWGAWKIVDGIGGWAGLAQTMVSGLFVSVDLTRGGGWAAVTLRGVSCIVSAVAMPLSTPCRS